MRDSFANFGESKAHNDGWKDCKAFEKKKKEELIQKWRDELEELRKNVKLVPRESCHDINLWGQISRLEKCANELEEIL